MKRDPNLRTLSWEHHEGLVLTFRIEQGLRKKSDVELVRAYVLDMWDEELTHHFWQEEQILPPVLNRTEDGKALLSKMIEDHEQFHRMISDIRKSKDKMEEKLGHFGKSLNAHIRFEERQLFPFVEEHSGKNEILRIGEFLHEQHRSGKKCWEPAFWRQEAVAVSSEQ